MIRKLRDLIGKDHRLTLRLIAEELGVSHETVCTILEKDLGKRKITIRPTQPHSEQRQLSFEASGDFIAMCDGVSGPTDF